jgi:UDP-N-acetylglucosamine 3-dehydrogenase
MTLRLGLVGRGPWGQNILRTLQTFSDVTVQPIARGEHFPAVDGVVIATQSASHAEVALPYIEAGIATFIEKPMATSIEDAERIGNAAKRSGAIVFVGHIFLFHPAFVAALELLPALGPIRYLLSEGMNNRSRADSSVLWDWLPHDLSMAYAIFRRAPESVSSWNVSGGKLAEAAVSKFEFGGTALVSITSWLSPLRRRQLTIAAEEATLVFDDKADRRLALYRQPGGEPSYPSYAAELPLTRELAAFVDAIRLGKPNPQHVELGVSIVRSIAAAEKSIVLAGRSVAL